LAGGFRMKACAEERLLRALLARVPVPKDQPLGPGDDCAAIRPPPKDQLLLLKTDCVAEGVHFLRSHDPARVGWKALCRPLSDIAAMGGTPREALVTFFSPPDVGAEYWKTFYRGLGRAARRFGVTIAGGEMSRQPQGIAVSIALLGTVARKKLLRRSGGKAGDAVFVTGVLGGTLARHHLDFVPRLAEGRWLAETHTPAAMMDVSDGLGSDLPRLARASGCGFEVDLEAIPRRRGADLRAALTDGEDYELLFSIAERKVPALMADWVKVFPKIRLTRIGRLTGKKTAPKNWPGGWDHFAF
jgi:thiamine-monophosphate kinase